MTDNQANCLQQRFAIAQQELNEYLEEQSQRIAPQPQIKFTDIDGFYNFEGYVNDKLIAKIFLNTSENKFSYWVVEVSGVELYHCYSFPDAREFVINAYNNNTLHTYRRDIVLSDREKGAQMVEVLEKHGSEYVVRNPQNNNHYVVRLDHPDVKMRCECPDCYFRGIQCKHQIAVMKHIRKVTPLPVV